MPRDSLLLEYISKSFEPILARLAALEARMAELENWRRWTEYSKHGNPVYAGGAADPPVAASDSPSESETDSDNVTER